MEQTLGAANARIAQLELVNGKAKERLSWLERVSGSHRKLPEKTIAQVAAEVSASTATEDIIPSSLSHNAMEEVHHMVQGVEMQLSRKFMELEQVWGRRIVSLERQTKIALESRAASATRFSRGEAASPSPEVVETTREGPSNAPGDQGAAAFGALRRTAGPGQSGAQNVEAQDSWAVVSGSDSQSDVLELVEVNEPGFPLPIATERKKWGVPDGTA